VVDTQDVMSALGDGLAVVSEWDGATVEDKLRANGFDPDAVKGAIEERYAAFAESSDYGPILSVPGATELFAAAYAEGLLAGKRL
jgi:hypothetical protein